MQAELIYTHGLPPRLTYTFKHALTQEAAYRSLLTAQRQALHHCVAVTLEALFPDRLDEHYGQLAHHFLEAAQPDEVDKAIDYAMLPGERNAALPAYAEAVRFYQMALDALERQASVDEILFGQILLVLGETQRKAGENVRALDTYLVEVCAFLGDTARAATLYELLLPYAGRAVFVGGRIVCYGAASRYLSVLATTMGRWQEAESHFEDALAMNTRMHARPWLAHTQHDYATMLLARNHPSDHEKAASLLHEALTTARELGMHALEDRMTAREDQHPPAVVHPVRHR